MFHSRHPSFLCVVVFQQPSISINCCDVANSSGLYTVLYTIPYTVPQYHIVLYCIPYRIPYLLVPYRIPYRIPYRNTVQGTQLLWHRKKPKAKRNTTGNETKKTKRNETKGSTREETKHVETKRHERKRYHLRNEARRNVIPFFLPFTFAKKSYLILLYTVSFFFFAQ